MTRRNRVRRVFILWRRRGLNQEAALKGGGNQFWVTTNGNNFDICVLEWCKLFGEDRGQHHWGKVVMRKSDFQQDLLSHIRMTPEQFEVYIKKMRQYRDKFVAHLDNEPVMYFPELRTARRSAAFLYRYLLQYEDDGGFFPESPASARDIYVSCLITGRRVYATSLQTAEEKSAAFKIVRP
jgi:hypothetical protein